MAVDEELWKECQEVMRGQKPRGLKHLAGKLKEGVNVLLVDGDYVKLHHDMDFVEGGNGLEDPDLCGHNEIFVDYNIAAHDWPFILYHEAIERRHMTKGDSYNRAHEKANRDEKKLRERMGVGK